MHHWWMDPSEFDIKMLWKPCFQRSPKRGVVEWKHCVETLLRVFLMTTMKRGVLLGVSGNQGQDNVIRHHFISYHVYNGIISITFFIYIGFNSIYHMSHMRHLCRICDAHVAYATCVSHMRHIYVVYATHICRICDINVSHIWHKCVAYTTPCHFRDGLLTVQRSTHKDIQCITSCLQ